VALAKHVLTGRPVAIKIIKKSKMANKHQRKKILM